MPAPIVIQQDEGLIRGIEQASGALGQALQMRRVEKTNADKIKKGGTILNQVLSQLPPNASIEQYQAAISQAVQQGVPLDLIKQYTDLYKPVLEQKAKAGEAQNFLKSIFPEMAMGMEQGQGPALTPMDGNPMQQQSMQPNQQMSPGMPGIPGMPMENQQPVSSIQSVRNAQKEPDQGPLSQPSGFDITKAPEASIMKLLLSPYKPHQQLAEAEIKRRDMEQRRFSDDRKYHAKGAEKAAEEANAIRRSVRGKEGALRLAREAIETGETGPLSWANIAKRLDIPEMMNAAGTELSQAGKEFFFGNMQRVSAKAQNQWLEQRITKLAAEVGDPKIAALMKQTMLEGELDLDKAYLDAYDRIAKEDMEKHKFIKNDIEERAFKESDAQSKKILDKTSFKTRQLYEEEKGAKWMIDNAMKKVPKGTILTPQMAKVIASKYEGDFKKAIENAKKLGYQIPTRQEVEAWQ